jgi:hypothetical protein
VVALVAGLLAACSGSETADPVPAPPSAAVAVPESHHLGTWRATPNEKRRRQLKIIDAALSGRPHPREQLGDLTGDEQALFDAWVGRRGPEVAAMHAEIRRMRSLGLAFSADEVAVTVAGEPGRSAVPYERVAIEPDRTVLSFDPGLGNGVETHTITWTGDGRGIDTRTAADGTALDELLLVKDGE